MCAKFISDNICKIVLKYFKNENKRKNCLCYVIISRGKTDYTDAVLLIEGSENETVLETNLIVNIP